MISETPFADLHRGGRLSASQLNRAFAMLERLARMNTEVSGGNLLLFDDGATSSIVPGDAADDHKVIVDGSDLIPDYLHPKIVAGGGIVITVARVPVLAADQSIVGYNEHLTISTATPGQNQMPVPPPSVTSNPYVPNPPPGDPCPGGGAWPSNPYHAPSLPPSNVYSGFSAPSNPYLPTGVPSSNPYNPGQLPSICGSNPHTTPPCDCSCSCSSAPPPMSNPYKPSGGGGSSGPNPYLPGAGGYNPYQPGGFGPASGGNPYFPGGGGPSNQPLFNPYGGGFNPYSTPQIFNPYAPGGGFNPLFPGGAPWVFWPFPPAMPTWWLPPNFYVPPNAFNPYAPGGFGPPPQPGPLPPLGGFLPPAKLPPPLPPPAGLPAPQPPPATMPAPQPLNPTPQTNPYGPPPPNIPTGFNPNGIPILAPTAYQRLYILFKWQSPPPTGQPATWQWQNLVGNEMTLVQGTSPHSGQKVWLAIGVSPTPLFNNQPSWSSVEASLDCSTVTIYGFNGSPTWSVSGLIWGAGVDGSIVTESPPYASAVAVTVEFGIRPYQ